MEFIYENQETPTDTMYMNGGKMQHVKKYEKSDYSPEFNSQDAKEAFEKGEIRIKYDGSCHMINIKTGEVFQRLDVRKGKTAPENHLKLDTKYGLPDKTPDGKHNYVWVPIDPPSDKDSKKNRKFKEKMFQRVEKYIRRMKKYEDQYKKPLTVKRTCEFVGKRYNKTIGFEDFEIVDHEYDTLLENNYFENYSRIPLSVACILETKRINLRDEKDIIQFVSDFPIEGFIYKHPTNGSLFKFRANMLLGNKCSHELYKRKKNSKTEEVYITPEFMVELFKEQME